MKKTLGTVLMIILTAVLSVNAFVLIHGYIYKVETVRVSNGITAIFGAQQVEEPTFTEYLIETVRHNYYGEY